MAKGSNRNRSRTRDVSSPSLTKLRSTPIVHSPVVTLREIEDRRVTPKSRPRSVSGSNYSLVAHPRPPARPTLRKTKVPYQVAFSNPRDLLICVRRKARKEVMHALNKAGRGGQRKPRRNSYSNIRC